MDKLLKDRKKLRVIAFSSLAAGVLCMAGIIPFAVNLIYAPFFICIAVTLYACYACPFLFSALAATRIYEGIILARQDGETSPEEIARRVFIKRGRIDKYIKKCVKKGYIAACDGVPEE